MVTFGELFQYTLVIIGVIGLVNEMPYSAKLTIAMMLQDRKTSDEIVCKAFEDMGHKLMAVVNSYDHADSPFVVATMLIVANTMKTILPKDGQALVETLVSHTKTMAVNMDELRRQAMEQNNGEQGKR